MSRDGVTVAKTIRVFFMSRTITTECRYTHGWAEDWKVEIRTELYFPFRPSVEFRTMCSEFFLWVMTHHRACIHTYTHRSALARQARKQPENTLATRHFAKHNTRTHTPICANTRRTLPLWAAGCLALAPDMAGRYFARLHFSILRKGHKTQTGEPQPSSIATERQAIC